MKVQVRIFFNYEQNLLKKELFSSLQLMLLNVPLNIVLWNLFVKEDKKDGSAILEVLLISASKISLLF